MPLLLLAIGLVIVIAAYRNTHRSLGAALVTDTSAFAVWAAAIIGIGAIGWVPQLKPVSRSLLVLVLLVLVISNYQAILTGLGNAWKGAAAEGAAGAASDAAGASGGGGGGLGGLGGGQLGSLGGSNLFGSLGGGGGYGGGGSLLDSFGGLGGLGGGAVDSGAFDVAGAGAIDSGAVSDVALLALA